MTEPSDEHRDLTEAARGGDPRALAGLFDRHRGRLRRMVEFRLDARLRGRVSPSDVLQEAYLDALTRLPHFRADPDVPFYVWARTVTLQRLIDVHRRHLVARVRSAAREVPLGRDDPTSAGAERMAELIADATSPSLAIHRREIVAAVREALDRLDPNDREVLALRHFEELSNQEAAAAMGIRPAAASKRYLRALDRLRRALEDAIGPVEAP